jgi:hypothetical protein
MFNFPSPIRLRTQITPNEAIRIGDIKMKNFYLLFTAILFSQILTAQVVNIPDANFKKVLVDNKVINTNNDAEIQVSEAIAYSATINCNSKGITNLTGIEAFVNIKNLYCGSNQLTTLDVSKNVNKLCL